MKPNLFDLSGKVAIVTGGNGGIGLGMAEALAARGANVVIAARSAAKAEAALASLRMYGTDCVFVAVDVTAKASCDAMVAATLDRLGRVDILVSNAGIGTAGQSSKRQTSQDGHELRFAVNYLAGFLLTRLLLPLLTASSPARIVMVASAGQQEIDFADVMLTRGYGGVRAYCQSKLAQIMFAADLAQELAGTGVTATSLHPASYMDTTMVRAAGVAPMSTVAQGADAILNLAASPEMAGRTGIYFDGLRPARPHAQAADVAARARLRALSLDLVGLPADA